MKDTWGLFMYLYFCFLSNVHDITYPCSINENTEVWGGVAVIRIHMLILKFSGKNKHGKK